MPLQPGELVVRRVRWQVDADLMGIVIGNTPEMPSSKDVLVMWTTGDQRVKFSWHLEDALLAVGPGNIAEVRGRCNLDF